MTLHFELFQTEKEFDILEIFDGGFCWNCVVCGKAPKNATLPKLLVSFLLRTVPFSNTVVFDAQLHSVVLNVASYTRF